MIVPRRTLPQWRQGATIIFRRWKTRPPHREDASLAYKFGTWYSTKLDAHPLATKCITSGIIAGLGDVTCQQIQSTAPWDPIRSLRFVWMGTVWVAPIVHVWYGRLAHYRIPTVPRVILDQFAFTPLFVPSFLGHLWLIEGKDSRIIVEDLKRTAPTVIVANWALWIPAQAINFHYVPTKYQVLFSNVVALIWNVYLSYSSHTVKTQGQN